MKNLTLGLIAATLMAAPAAADTIAIIGTGGVGSALGAQFADAGHTVVYGSRTPNDADVLLVVGETGNGATATTQAEAVKGADIVVLAIPWAPAKDVVAGLGSLDGKIIIDPINALAFGAEKSVTVAADPSTAELIQSWAPKAHVVKAFNTLTRAFMVDPSAAEGPITIPLAGDNQAAKAVVAALVEAMGLEPLDLGPLSHARSIEAMGQLYVAQGYQGRTRFEFYLMQR
ncbi:MAG: NAD(P)-binding domain-containing protein [Rhodospirillaceae bacterium]